MQTTFPRVPMLAVTAAALAVAVPAMAASGGVTLHLNGGKGTGNLKACGVVAHDTLYNTGGKISFNGTVPSATGKFTVNVRTRACVKGKWVSRLNMTVSGSAGKYKGSFATPAKGTYFARTLYTKGKVLQKSSRQYFKVG